MKRFLLAFILLLTSVSQYGQTETSTTVIRPGKFSSVTVDGVARISYEQTAEPKCCLRVVTAGYKGIKAPIAVKNLKNGKLTVRTPDHGTATDYVEIHIVAPSLTAVEMTGPCSFMATGVRLDDSFVVTGEGCDFVTLTDFKCKNLVLCLGGNSFATVTGLDCHLFDFTTRNNCHIKASGKAHTVVNTSDGTSSFDLDFPGARQNINVKAGKTRKQ